MVSSRFCCSSLHNYEKGKYATIDITYDDATKTVSFGARKGQFPGMLKNRQFNVVLISKDASKPLKARAACSKNARDGAHVHAHAHSTRVDDSRVTYYTFL